MGSKEEAGQALGKLGKDLDLFFRLFNHYEEKLEYLRRNPGCLLQMEHWIHPEKAVRLKEEAKKAWNILGVIVASMEVGLLSPYHQEREPEEAA